MGDADDSYDFGEIPKFARKIAEGFDLVQGCRLPAGGGKVAPGAMPWSHRWIGNPMFSFMVRTWFHAPIHDVYCGMRCFTRKLYDSLDQQCTGMEFATEMIIKASLAKVRISEVPITLHPDGRSRPPHLRSWRDGWRHLRFMMLFSPRWLFLIPGLSCGGLGVLLFAPLSFGPLYLGNIRLDINTLLVSSLLILLGFQLVYFASFLRIYGFTQGFLPDQPQLRRLLRFITLEKGLLLGLALMGTGLSFLSLAIWAWANAGFGALDPVASLHRVIPAVTFIALGAQIIFGSFFLSALGINKPVD
ncbi:MAG: glycosyltransferase family 2 protein [Verrucomicrobia bacterium]|nr:glycosyltransferase family 2 protein [Verrucomicrobiota bacterium]